MMTADGPRVLEYNCRFGDPETQSVLPLVAGDLGAVLAAAAAGDLAGTVIENAAGAAVTVVIAGADYPSAPLHGSPISGLAEAEATGAVVFHAGTALRDGEVVANGGRILGVTATGESIAAARDAAYRAVDLIELPSSRVRSDIAAEAAAALNPAARTGRSRASARRRSLSGHSVVSGHPVGPPQTTTHFEFYRRTRDERLTALHRLRADFSTGRPRRTPCLDLTL